MKTLKKLSIIVAVGLSTIFFSGCSDYLMYRTTWRQN